MADLDSFLVCLLGAVPDASAGASGAASPEDRWLVEATYARADHSAIRVTLPAGYRVSVVIAGQVEAVAAPAVFHVPDGDHDVTFTAPSGTTWTSRIVVGRFQIATLRVRHVVAPPRLGSAIRALHPTERAL